MLYLQLFKCSQPMKAFKEAEQVMVSRTIKICLRALKTTCRSNIPAKNHLRGRGAQRLGVRERKEQPHFRSDRRGEDSRRQVTSVHDVLLARHRTELQQVRHTSRVRRDDEAQSYDDKHNETQLLGVGMFLFQRFHRTNIARFKDRPASSGSTVHRQRHRSNQSQVGRRLSLKQSQESCARHVRAVSRKARVCHVIHP